MKRFLAIGALLLECAFLGNACPYYCASKEQCLQEATIFDYHSRDCPDQQVCCGILNNNNPQLPQGPSKNKEECGMSNPNGLDFQLIPGTGDTKPGQYPWVVALFINDDLSGSGSLIRRDVVLTSAHIVVYKNANDMVVRAGEWDMNTEAEDFHFEERQVERTEIHEKFNYTAGDNNVALLFLQKPYDLGEHINTICLPTPRTSYANRQCIVTGWGKKQFWNVGYSAVLKKVVLPMVDRSWCQEQLRKTALGWKYELAQSLICAGGEANQDACTGDGGSALFCSIGAESSRIYEQIGIVNWGMGCGQKDMPGTYTNVAMFREWIDTKLIAFFYKK
ncbi:phenoloxidase-activating factor 2-like [Drosophila eugracilis]|uniref:phenoloxidase-activating factor 2-like n=1 Tax=Drosophila eugracilis TaxID=29029 RepID=UPI001BD94D3A|nr:phenoloxidase-activating factor 2-like [Drosophila eugracilis]